MIKVHYRFKKEYHATGLKDSEDKVYLIWTVLSSFEESSATAISNMLMHVSTGAYYESVLEAENFILHVEILFKAIDSVAEKLASLDQVFGKTCL